MSRPLFQSDQSNCTSPVTVLTRAPLIVQELRHLVSTLMDILDTLLTYRCLKSAACKRGGGQPLLSGTQ